MTDDLDDFDLTGALPFDHDADAETPQKPISTTLGIGFDYIGEAHTTQSFASYCASYHFGPIPPDFVVVHHTAIPSTLAARYPTGAVWDANENGMTVEQIKAKRLRQLGQLRDFYRDVRQWHAGPHLFIDERWIYLFTPMYDVGVHAAQGNSYRDSGRRLHYSIGIEVLGYYEHVHWPPAVAANVRGAVATLKDRLKTFDYIDKPWAGGIGSHRMYNKPQCPGAAITPSYYMSVLKNDRPEHRGLTHYRVLPSVSGGATIRSAPHRAAPVLGRLHAGDEWWGEAILGQQVSLPGFRSGNVWIRSDDMRVVWAGLLEAVKE